MTAKTIAGTVDADGNIISGAGFNINKVSKGHYVIIFEPPFARVGGGSASQVFRGDGDTRDNVVFVNLDNASCEAKTGDSGGKAQDRKFTFIFFGEFKS